MGNIIQTCKQSGVEFNIAEEDRRFYEKIGATLPRLCPEERQRRRIAWRNFMKLYYGKCHISGKTVLTTFHPNYDYKVLSPEEWYGDGWEAMDYGRNYDLNKSFFDQWTVLHKEVPHLSLAQTACENCQFTNYSGYSKNCYMLYGCIRNENCYYGHIVWDSEFSLDCSYSQYLKWCYECTDCQYCYELSFSSSCINCSSSSYLYHCKNCEECTGCYGLVRAKWCVANKKYNSKEEYELARANFLNLPHRQKEVQILELKKSVPIEHATIVNSENCWGDFIYDSRNVGYSFDIYDCEDCKYCYTLGKFKDSQDCSYTGIPSELCYNCMFVTGQNLICCLDSWQCRDSAYLLECRNCENCFGCIGLKNKKFCIFNKQYSQDEYFKLKAEIINNMTVREEWCEFFPIKISPFPYNDTMAQEFFPMTKEDALKANFKWQNEIDRGFYDGPKTKLSNTKATDKEVCKKILTCEITDKPYKIIPQEFEFYQKLNLPLPKRCPEQRHKDRMKVRNPRGFWDRKCDKCTVEIKTTYSPERPEKVYCEKCYNKFLY